MKSIIRRVLDNELLFEAAQWLVIGGVAIYFAVSLMEKATDKYVLIFDIVFWAVGPVILLKGVVTLMQGIGNFLWCKTETSEEHYERLLR